MTTTLATIERRRDPYLGLRYIVACPWHGAVGRYKFKANAEIALRRHEGCTADREATR